MSLMNAKWLAEHFEQEIPVGTVNGSNKVFTMSEAPHTPKSVIVLLNSLVQYQVSNYTVDTSGVITFVEAPVLGQEPYVFYMKKVS
jgi:hypothetical protein